MSKQIFLKIDNRENKCIPYFDNIKSNIVFENLVYGDFQIVTSTESNNKIHFIFERKTLDDLLASIKDGRYKNQKSNILSNFHHTQYYYIIEGSIQYKSNTKSNLNEKILHSAIINTLLRDKIGIFFTKNTNETCELICSIYQRISDKPDEYLKELENELSKNVEIEKQIVTKKVKSNIECWKEQLCQIPDVSIKTAEAIIKEFSSMKLFYTAFKDCSKEECSKKLETIKTIDNNGKQRKISSKVVQNIIDYVLF